MLWVQDQKITGKLIYAQSLSLNLELLNYYDLAGLLTYSRFEYLPKLLLVFPKGRNRLSGDEFIKLLPLLASLLGRSGGA